MTPDSLPHHISRPKTRHLARSVLRFLLTCGLLIGSAAHISAQSDNQAQAVREAGRRVLATTSLAAKEYAVGVAGGTVVASAEVDEALLFLKEAGFAAGELPAPVASQVGDLVGAMRNLVQATGTPSAVQALSDSLGGLLMSAIPGLSEHIPMIRPDFARGAAVYAEGCTQCHGDRGTGDGPKAADLDPAPSDLTDRLALAGQSPLDFFRKISIGVSGTDMPSFEGQYSEEDLWAVAWHAFRLRYSEQDVARGASTMAALCRGCDTNGGVLPGPAYLPEYVADAEALAQLSDDELSRLLVGYAGETATLDSATVGSVVAYLRDLPFAEGAAAGNAATFARVRTNLLRGLRLSHEGHDSIAAARMLDA